MTECLDKAFEMMGRLAVLDVEARELDILSELIDAHMKLVEAAKDLLSEPTPYQCGYQRATMDDASWTRKAEEKENALRVLLGKE